GHENVRKSQVRAAIDAGLKGCVMPANEVLARLSEIASTGLEPFMEVSEFGAWSLNVAKAKNAGRLWMLKKIKPTELGTEIEAYSALDALDKLAKVHGLYLERSEVTTNTPVVKQVNVPVKNDDSSDIGSGAAGGTSM